MNTKRESKAPVGPIAYAVSVTLAGGVAPAVVAQQQPPVPQSADLDAVIVTARKREETLLDIPQEIQAISQQQLERANLDSVEDFSRFVPSLSYTATVPGRGTIYFRGVADDSSSFIADASAAIYLDEQPLTQSSLQPEIRLIDIERIEALPGPQGTLYGASSQAGTLRYITNKPDPTAFTTDVSLDAYTVDHGDEGYEVSGVVNVPLADNVALRVVGFSARDAGFIDNIFGTSLGGTFDNAEFVEDDVNHSEHLGGRAALRWLPNENWTVDAGVVYQQMRANSYAEEDLSNGINGHTELAGRELSVVRFLDESRSDEWTQLALTLQGDLGFAQFTSATSYFTRRIAYHQDNTDYTFYLSHAFGANYAVYDLGPDPVGLGWRDGPFTDRIAQEFRLQGSSEKFTWVTGLFYEHIDEGFNFFSRIQDYEDTPGFTARQYYAIYYNEDPIEPGSTDNAFYHAKNNQTTEQYAAFGELTWSPNDDWSFTAGLRWFDHTRQRTYYTQQPNGHSSSLLPTAENSTSDFTKKLSVQYNFNENAMVYALYSDGFRAGGRNVVRPNTVLPADYEADFLDNYEVGFKSRWAGGRFGLNLTAFQMEWKDYQIEVVDPGPLFAILVANVGDAEIKGVTLDVSAYLWDSLDVGLNLQLLDPKTKANEPLLGLLPGDRLPFSAKEKGSIWAEYTFPGELAGGHVYTRLQWTYTGNSLNGLPTPIVDDAGNVVDIVDPDLQPAYQITDFKVGLSAGDWEVYAYVDNLFDERAILFNQFTELGLHTNDLRTVNDPRTWGVGFTKSWGKGR
ncbi:MAG TPA: TonB-dependent receptor [Steroidobacteraceae bacterium]|nr:TonB-dependent receptor [Steroidobacteraceae bacterium]